ncbi:Cupin 1 [Dillenia turbinata]|uniref:Germin-like protein n=1 Tax=Dillenia turbinata TaxID=194707 RepID=A0AAN8Z8U2_9MAGN
MAPNTLTLIFLLSLAVFSITNVTKGSDPDILTDFVAPPGSNSVDGTFFAFNGLRYIFDSDTPATFNVSKASMKEFPALNGQSVSYAVLRYPSGSVNPTHTHPRASELLFVVEGSLEVGFVDTTNKLYTRSLQLGDMFIFPKGLVHYQYNADAKNPATALSAFGSASAGTVSLPATLFNTSIDDTILATAFKTDVATIQTLKAGFAAKA